MFNPECQWNQLLKNITWNTIFISTICNLDLFNSRTFQKLLFRTIYLEYFHYLTIYIFVFCVIKIPYPKLLKKNYYTIG